MPTPHSSSAPIPRTSSGAPAAPSRCTRARLAVTVVCLSYGERGECAKLWRQPGMTLERVKAERQKEAEAAADVLGVHDIQFWDLGDYPITLNDESLFRLVDVYRAIHPALRAHPLEGGHLQPRPSGGDATSPSTPASPPRRMATTPARRCSARRPSSCSSRTSPSSAAGSPTCCSTSRRSGRRSARPSNAWPGRSTSGNTTPASPCSAARRRRATPTRRSSTARATSRSSRMSWRALGVSAPIESEHQRGVIGRARPCLKVAMGRTSAPALSTARSPPTCCGSRMPASRRSAAPSRRWSARPASTSRNGDRHLPAGPRSGKPLVLLRVVLAARFQEAVAACRAMGRSAAARRPREGRRIGVRAYSQTTGMWLRGTLADRYGLGPRRCAGPPSRTRMSRNTRDPPWGGPRPAGQRHVAMLRDGTLDAAIFGNDTPAGGDLRTSLPRPDGRWPGLPRRAWLRPREPPAGGAAVPGRA